MENKKKTKVVIVGTGNVGATTAYTLLLQEPADELILIDKDEAQANAHALDLNHCLPLISKTHVRAGTNQECKDADIIIITAGVAQKPYETRIDLLKNNIAIMDDIISSITPYNQEAVLLVVTNPVDILSYYTFKKSEFAQHKVIGSGTLLDSTFPLFNRSDIASRLPGCSRNYYRGAWRFIRTIMEQREYSWGKVTFNG